MDCGTHSKLLEECSARTGPPRRALSAAENFLFGLLSFLVPALGAVLCIVWREDLPQTARIAGACALVSVILLLQAASVLIIAFITNAAF